MTPQAQETNTICGRIKTKINAQIGALALVLERPFGWPQTKRTPKVAWRQGKGNNACTPQP